MHLCERQSNLTRRACCQLVLLLNDTTKVPFCNELLTQNYSDYTFYSPPVFLDEPADVREDHVTFLLGIMVLMLVACGCIFTLSRLTKPRFRINYGTISNYDFMMWMPTKANRRSSVMVLLRGMTCRRTPNNRSSNISVVSSNIGLLPSYQTATSTPTSALSSFPPPPYAETQRLTEENQSL
ncbi:unnamed protein product [Cylicocyclus nassatus]|uniref:Uncharacterized protein n=1 Tax=Cylicocyclus nassatus TaxID=53992 RepID=A0AA36DJI2_CYLNA|nr:unnamed protein product [Cylicocyclus nassatus]